MSNYFICPLSMSAGSIASVYFLSTSPMIAAGVTLGSIMTAGILWFFND